MKIAHVSDIHVFDGSSLSVRALLNKRVMGALNWWLIRHKKHSRAIWEAMCKDLAAQNPDHVVITGDLSNMSLPSEFARVRRDLDALPLDPQRISVIPGNHDVYIPKVQRERLFETWFSPYMTSSAEALQDARRNARHRCFFPFVRVLPEKIVILGVSTAVPTSFVKATGCLGHAQLRCLRDRLLQWQGYYRVVLIHHPPVKYKRDWFRGLRDKEALHRVIAEVGCELLLHGHEHRDLLNHVQGPSGPIPVIGVGSGTYADPRQDRCGRYNLYTITNGKMVSEEVRIYDAKQGFVTYQNPTFSKALELV